MSHPIQPKLIPLHSSLVVPSSQFTYTNAYPSRHGRSTTTTAQRSRLRAYQGEKDAQQIGVLYLSETKGELPS